MTCRRGEIVLVLFPDSNLRTSKRRPALIVQADGLGADLPQTLVAMISSNMARAGHRSRVILRDGGKAAEGSGPDGLGNHDPLLRLKYREAISNAVAELGKPEEIGILFAGFQNFLERQEGRKAGCARCADGALNPIIRCMIATNEEPCPPALRRLSLFRPGPRAPRLV